MSTSNYALIQCQCPKYWGDSSFVACDVAKVAHRWKDHWVWPWKTSLSNPLWLSVLKTTHQEEQTVLVGVRGGKICFQGLSQKSFFFGKKQQTHQLGYCPSFQPPAHVILIKSTNHSHYNCILYLELWIQEMRVTKINSLQIYWDCNKISKLLLHVPMLFNIRISISKHNWEICNRNFNKNKPKRNHLQIPPPATLFTSASKALCPNPLSKCSNSQAPTTNPSSKYSNSTTSPTITQ